MVTRSIREAGAICGTCEMHRERRGTKPAHCFLTGDSRTGSRSACWRWVRRCPDEDEEDKPVVPTGPRELEICPICKEMKIVTNFIAEHNGKSAKVARICVECFLSNSGVYVAAGKIALEEQNEERNSIQD